MNLADALAEGLRVTVIGLIIVFAVLIILMLVMMAMKVIFYKENKDEGSLQTAATAPAATAKSDAAESTMDEEELIAVLTAAVAASLNTSTYHLNIKSYRRIGNSAPSWNQAGLRDVIDARF